MSNLQNEIFYENYYEMLEESGQKHKNQKKKSFIEETDDFVFNQILNLK